MAVSTKPPTGHWPLPLHVHLSQEALLDDPDALDLALGGEPFAEAFIAPGYVAFEGAAREIEKALRGLALNHGSL